MTPVERLRKAINKLERLTAETTQGPWDSERGGVIIYSDSLAGQFVASADTPHEARLIVTLHATIDAQLAILRDTLNMFVDPIPLFAGHEERICFAQLALADAILGGTA